MFSALATALFGAATTYADVSYNVGWASEYYFRGALQQESSASAGVDFDQDGFYAGAWTADVGEGLEYDLYAGYGIELEGGLSASVGFTGYYYTDDVWDELYQADEINVNVGFGAVGVEYSFGDAGGSDYNFLALNIDLTQGFSVTYGTFGDESDGDYFEIGYGTTIADIDVGVSAIFSSEELSDQVQDFRVEKSPKESGQAIVFTLGKSW
jgi:uncharacterized protein (TIGR02001 family)